jgi:hypothetical protein
MANAGSSSSARSPGKQSGWLKRVLRRHAALFALLIVGVLLTAGCSAVIPAKAHQRPTQTTVAPGDQDPTDSTTGNEDPTDSTSADDPGDQDPTDSTTGDEDPTDTTAADDPGDQDPTDTTAGDDQDGEEEVDDTFAANACSPDGLNPATGDQTKVGGAAVCSTNAFGVFPAPDKSPIVRITSPRSGQRFAAGTEIPCAISFVSFHPGLFDQPADSVDADNDGIDDATGQPAKQGVFGLRPFSIDENGNAIGHAHCYIRAAGSASSTLQSFLALNAEAEDLDAATGTGTLSGVMPGVTAAGRKDLCVDLAGGNHVTFPKGVAQQFPATHCIQIRIR